MERVGGMREPPTESDIAMQIRSNQSTWPRRDINVSTPRTFSTTCTTPCIRPRSKQMFHGTITPTITNPIPRSKDTTTRSHFIHDSGRSWMSDGYEDGGVYIDSGGRVSGMRARESEVGRVRTVSSPRALGREPSGKGQAEDSPSSPSSRTSTHSYPLARSRSSASLPLSVVGSAIGFTEGCAGR